jgi:hypothetical protein
MFELGRDLFRWMGGGRAATAPSDGLTSGDPALMQLLDLALLVKDGKGADVAAGRISARDRPQRRLEAALVWREVARRSADPAALRKAAAAAEAAGTGFSAARKPERWARARCEQAWCALLGAELFGDPGLEAAAEASFREARGAFRGGPAAPAADLGLAVILARREMERGDLAEARAAHDRFTAPITALEAFARRGAPERLALAEARLARAEILIAWGARLGSLEILDLARDDAAAAARRLEPAYEPLTLARAETVRGRAMTAIGRVENDLEGLAGAAGAVAAALDQIGRDHSPADWARAQIALGQALESLGEASASGRALDQATACYERAGFALRDFAANGLRAEAAMGRAGCLAKAAELAQDLAMIETAETALRMELASLHAGRDPVGWALCQVQLARLYEARIAIAGADQGRRSAALLALEAAIETLAEEGMQALAEPAVQALTRLRAAVRAPSPPR